MPLAAQLRILLLLCCAAVGRSVAGVQQSGAAPAQAVTRQADYDRLRVQAAHLSAREIEALRKQASTGDLASELLLGMACHLGSGGTLRDEREAQTWFRRAATQGSSIAATQIALFYDTLTGSGRNPEESLKWYEEAAQMDNDAVAETNLGEIYQELHRYDEAADWYRKALENDSTRAALHLVVLANDGLGPPSGNKKHRKEEVLSLLRQLAADGNAAAQTAMGFIAQNGWLDTHRDPQDAVGWFRKATDQDDSQAMVALAKWFLHSTSSSQKEEAVRLLLKAAEEGDHDSYAELGRVYESGQGTRQDPVLAYAWYRLATDLNPCPECKECESCEHERALARELTPEQMARAEARVEDFKYAHGFRSGQR